MLLKLCDYIGGELVAVGTLEEFAEANEWSEEYTDEVRCAISNVGRTYVGAGPSPDYYLEQIKE
jgi:hypothetical protein